MNIIPFDGGANLPAYLTKAAAAQVNQDIVTTAPYPTMSIKGKQWAVVRDGVRTTLMKPPPDDDEAVQKVEAVPLRVNMLSRVYYAKKFSEDDSSGVPPDCLSMDGQRPSANAANPQSATCASCPHSVWGTGNPEKGTGRACGDTPRMAIAAPDNLDDVFLLRMPPASIKNWKEAVKIAKQRNIPYNSVVMRMSFDKEQSSPMLEFKPVGLLDDAAYAHVMDTLYDGDLVRSVIGLDEPALVARDVRPAPAAKPDVVAADELDAALAARAATEKAKAKPLVTDAEVEAAVAAVEAKAAKAAKAEAPAPAPAPAKAQAAAIREAIKAKDAATGSDLLAQLDALLGSPDD